MRGLIVLLLFFTSICCAVDCDKTVVCGDIHSNYNIYSIDHINAGILEYKYETIEPDEARYELAKYGARRLGFNIPKIFDRIKVRVKYDQEERTINYRIRFILWKG
jgi:hypothetical protein